MYSFHMTIGLKERFQLWRLRRIFKVRNNSDLIRKALALSRIAAEQANDYNIVTIQRPNGTLLRVDLLG